MSPRTDRAGRRAVLQLAAVLAFALVLAGCAREEPAPAAGDRLILERAGIRDLPGWDLDDQRPALAALSRSCASLLRGDQSRAVGPDDGDRGTKASIARRADLAALVARVMSPAPRSAPAEWEARDVA